jgi:adenylate kinase family enzyme
MIKFIERIRAKNNEKEVKSMQKMQDVAAPAAPQHKILSQKKKSNYFHSDMIVDLDTFDFNKLQKVNIIGTSGSGKSYFARTLASVLQIEYIEMDHLYWLDDWIGKSDEVFFDTLDKTLSQNSWILDGNYARTESIKWKEVETVIWLHYPFHFVFWRIFKRSIYRIISRKSMWNTNNKESLKLSFFDKESIIWWMITTYYPNRKRNYAAMNNSKHSHIQFLELKSQKETDSFIKNVKYKYS